MQFSRRSLFSALGALIATPAVAKMVSLIPPLEAARMRSVDYLTMTEFTRKSARLFVNENWGPGKQYSELFSAPNSKIGTTLRIRLPEAPPMSPERQRLIDSILS